MLPLVDDAATREATTVTVRHALEQGYLTSNQVREALYVQQELEKAGRPAPLLSVLHARYLQPEHVPPLLEVYRERLAAVRAAELAGTSERLPEPAEPPGPPAALDPAALPDDLVARSAEIVISRPVDADPEEVRRFISDSTQGTDVPAVGDVPDRVFASLARRVGYPTKAELRACREEQLERRERGERRSLLQVAVRRGCLDERQVRRYRHWSDQVQRRDPGPLEEEPPEPESGPGEAEPPEAILVHRSAAELYFSSREVARCPRCGAELDDLAVMEGRARTGEDGGLECVCDAPAAASSAEEPVETRPPVRLASPGRSPAPEPRRSPDPEPAAAGPASERAEPAAPRRPASDRAARAAAPPERPPPKAPAPRKERRGESGPRPAAPARSRRSSRPFVLVVAGAVALGAGVVGLVAGLLLGRLSATPSDDGPTTVTPTPTVDDQAATDADWAWQAVREAPPEDAARLLLDFADDHPDDPRAAHARRFAELLERAASAGVDPGAAGGGASSDLTPLLGEARGLAEDQPAAAAALLDLLARRTEGGPLAALVARERRRLERRARRVGAGLARDVEAALADGRPGAALRVLRARRAERWRGVLPDGELDRLWARAAEGATAAAAAAADALSTRVAASLQEAEFAGLRFDFDAARAAFGRLLAEDLDPATRLRAHWIRSQVQALEDLTAAAHRLARGPPEDRPVLTIRGDLRGRVVAIEERGVVLEPILDEEGEARMRIAWKRLSPGQLQQLVAPAGRGDLRLTLAKAFHALRVGSAARGHELLVPLAEDPARRSEVSSFYALVREEPLPAGGYVVFEGRLVAPSGRDEVLAAREAAALEEVELARAVDEAEDRAALARVLERAEALMAAGHYAAGRAAYAQIASRHADVPGVGDVARARLESPILRRRDLREARGADPNGPPASRLDVYVLGDGYVVEDGEQAAYDRSAEELVRLCRAQDFFREYDAFINYWAVNLASPEAGVTTGETARDTALGSAYADGRYEVPERGRAFAVLDAVAPEEHDGLAVVVGNVSADVATGGGGVAACPRDFVSATPHELGHAFVGLGDEYDFEAGGLGPAAGAGGAARVLDANVVAGPDEAAARAIVPWAGWLDPTGRANWTGRAIDLFEGAGRQATGAWRPQESCLMREVGSATCAVCMEQFVLRLYEVATPIEAADPAAEEVELDRELTLQVALVAPRSRPLEVRWTAQELDRSRRPEEEPEALEASSRGDRGRVVSAVTLRRRDLAPGLTAVVCTVVDPTPWVLDANRERVTKTRRWIVER